MDGIMTKIAYKLAKDDPTLPNGFVIDHFETENSTEEGYIVTSKENFSLILSNSANLYLNYERNKGIVLDTGKMTEPVKKVAEPLTKSQIAEEVSDSKKAEEEELFKQFLAWKASQSNNS